MNFKSEREKMLAGELYDFADKELVERWHTAKDLLRQLSTADTRDKAELDRIYTALFGSRGVALTVVAPFCCDYGENIHIGNNTEINHNCVFLDCNTITIGENVLIAPSVQLYAAYHPLKVSERVLQSTHDSLDMAYCVNKSAPITIGNNVWIGGGAIVLSGVTIGDGAVIGAGSVVTRDVPPNVLALGNPCRVVRKL